MGIALLRACFSRFLNNDDGAILPMAAVMFPVIMGMVGLGVDASAWMMSHRNLQNAADAAAVSAAWEIAYGYDDYEEAGLREAENNGYDPTRAGSHLNIELVTEDDGTQKISADLQTQAPLWFSRLILSDEVTLANAAATAIIEPSGNYCILSLDETADGAISAMGNAEVDANGCGLAVNSNSDNALDFTGSVVMHVGDVSIVGEHEVGSNVDFEYQSIRTNANPIPDPYTDIEVPSYAGRNVFTSNADRKATGTKTFQPGVYVGGLSTTGNGTVTFADGIYIIDGGDLSFGGGGAVVGENVTFILTNSSNPANTGIITITGGKTFDLSAPDEGMDMSGILLYQDRRSTNTARMKFVGGSTVDLDGLIYTPSATMDFGGNNTTTSPDTCTKIIAQKVKLHGTPGLGNSCEGNSDIRDFGKPNIRLVL